MLATIQELSAVEVRFERKMTLPIWVWCILVDDEAILRERILVICYIWTCKWIAELMMGKVIEMVS